MVQDRADTTTRRDMLVLASAGTAAVALGAQPAVGAETGRGKNVVVAAAQPAANSQTGQPASEKPIGRQPLAELVPKPGAKVETGRYGPVVPVSVANGMCVVGKIPPERKDEIIAAGKTIVKAVTEDPHALDVLTAHYIRFAIFDNGTRFMYNAIFDTDLDKYIEDFRNLFIKYNVNPPFQYIEGCPPDWKTNVPAFATWIRQNCVYSFAEYSSHPYATVAEINKALRVKDSLGVMLDQMQ